MDEKTTNNYHNAIHVADVAEMPDVPGLDAFEEFEAISRVWGHEDCDRCLHFGPYVIYHVRELEPGEPCPRVISYPYGTGPDGSRVPLDPIYAEERDAGWYAEAHLALPSTEAYRDRVRSTYAAARGMPGADAAREHLVEARDALVNYASLMDELPRKPAETDGWRFSLGCIREDTGEVVTERRVSPWGFYRFAVVSGADTGVISGALDPRPAKAKVRFERFLDILFAGFDSQDDEVCDFCEDSCAATGDLDAPFVYVLEVERAK